MFRPMSGMLFEYPCVRFSRRFWLSEVITRSVASLLSRRFPDAVRRLFRSRPRPDAVELTAATQPAHERLEWTFGGPRAAARASYDALRPNYNSVNTEDHYGISIIWEKFASSTWRWLPQKGRRSPLPAEHASKGAGQTNVLAENHGLLLARREPATAGSQHSPGRTAAQWLRETCGRTCPRFAQA